MRDLTSHTGRSPTHASHARGRECCSEPECKSGQRNLYFPGKKLSPDSMHTEQEYLVGRRQLLNRAIHGWGVVYGYRMDIEGGRFRAGPGLALDRHGRELVEVTDEWQVLGDLPVFEGGKPSKLHKLPEGSCWQIRVHYAEQLQHPVVTSDSCSCERQRWDRVCETVRYALHAVPCEQCCNPQPCDLECECSEGPCCAKSREAGIPAERGGCDCLCHHLMDLAIAGGCDGLEDLDECCGHVRADWCEGVPLACVELAYGECGWEFGAVDPCGPRRLVKRNDLLFDLIRGCDLTTIVEFGWRDWHRSGAIEFANFQAAMGPEITHGDSADEYLTNSFWVRFSRPVRRESLLPDVFAISVLVQEPKDGWLPVLRVPIIRIDDTVVPPEPGDPNDCARGARVVVQGRWYRDAVRGDWTIFHSGFALVEIEVRGDLIVDCNGQPVDANAIGLARQRTGNGTRGGTFLSTIGVLPGEGTAPSPTYLHRSGRGVL